jgi:SAM-dependent methyltransferase
MLALLKNWLIRSGRSADVTLQEAYTTRLPFSDGAFDMALVVRLFYFITQWKGAADEILRVVRPDGPVVLMHTGMGAEVPFLNQRCKELCAEQGCLIRWLGVRSTKEVVAYYEDIGCSVEWVRDRWLWTSRIRLDEALNHIRSHAYSFTTFAPNDVHVAAVEKLESELEYRFGSLTAEAEVENQIYYAVVER